ncbi:uncharacterized protein LOC111785194 isoform X1 [Cucurbita pepo subsp. pepo]|uniref:uncharacterized protein LOC111785194 isoform X1 n=1 Tax=Cucurbita pepo subsp. pepo TaxID=3664 RepID=UPI000C9D8C21|nr:uncharacterized protein LOC111785194 isoform X1 [Cucurbita pepo subsp. pepo]
MAISLICDRWRAMASTAVLALLLIFQSIKANDFNNLCLLFSCPFGLGSFLSVSAIFISVLCWVTSDFVMAENVCLEVKYTMEEEPVKLLGMRLSRLDVIMIVGGSRLFLTMDGHFTFLPCIIPKDFSEITEEVSVCSGDSIQSAIFFSTAPRDSDSLFLFLKI